MPPEIALIPLIGHTYGHAGVAVKSEGKWYFDVGDAYFYFGEMNYHKPCCTRGLMLYQNMMDKDHKARVWNQGRLRELKKNHAADVEIFCSHDVYEFERLAERSARIPAEQILQKSVHAKESYRPYI